jgi:hypothetical protein
MSMPPRLDDSKLHFESLTKPGRQRPKNFDIEANL